MLTALRKHTKVIMGIVIAFFVVSIFAGYGMYSRSGHGEGGRDYAVAKIDGNKVMRSDVDRAMMHMLEQMPNAHDIGSDDVLQARKAVVDSMAVQRELEKEAKSRKVEATKDEVDATYHQIMDQYPTREAFFEFLKHANVTEQQVKEDIKNQLTQQKVITDLVGDVVISEDEAVRYYDITKGFLFHQPAGYKLDIATFANKAAAEKSRKTIAGGADWDTTLKAVASADMRGFTPKAQPEFMPENIMTGPFEVLQKLEIGKVSGVIEITSDDFSFAIKRSKEAERTLPYAEVSADVRNTLKQQKVQIKQGEVFNDLLTRANVEILDASIFPAPRAPLPLIGSTGPGPASQDKPASGDAPQQN